MGNHRCHKNTLLLKCLNEKINVKQLENKMKILNEDIKNKEEIRDYKGKYKRYNELWKNKSKYRDYMTVTEEEEGGYIYLGYYAQFGWGVDPQGECRCYYIFKIGQTQDCVKCRISKQNLTKILAIKVKDAKKVETAILNRCYNKNIDIVQTKDYRPEGNNIFALIRQNVEKSGLNQ